MERSEDLPVSRIGMKKRKISEEVEFYENRDRKKIIIAKREVPQLSKAFLRSIYQYTKLEGGDHAKIGDTIKCLDPNDMINYVRTLRKEGYKINIDLRECLITIRRTPEEPENE
jgi:hypothetical protein